MPSMRVNGVELHYADEGTGEETIVFAHGLLWDHRMFDAQVAKLRDRYRCVAFDFRGQGRSEITGGGYDMDTLAADTIGLIEGLGIARCHFAGLSMGGFVGMRVAARRPDLLQSLILLDTAAEEEPAKNLPRYRRLTFVARWIGMTLVTGPVMKLMFGPKFLEEPRRAAERDGMKKRLAAIDRRGVVRAVKGVIERESVLPELERIQCPTLVIVGDADAATPPSKARVIHQAIAGSKLVVVPNAGHTSCVEEPEAVTGAMATFLDELPRV